MSNNNSKGLRTGIIGTGAMGKNHMRVVHSIPEMSLTCAVDINRENLEGACNPYQSFDLKRYTDYRDIVDQVDAVMVSTPTITHHEIAHFFLENKKHVLLEKPITQTLEQADDLIQTAKVNNVILAVGHLERFNPAVEYVQPLIERPLFIEIQRLGSFSPRSLDVDVIMDLMIHDLDILQTWDNSGIKQINASGIPIISDKIDIANVRLEFNSKLVANVTASRVSQEKTRKLRIFQKNRYFSVDYKKRSVKSFILDHGNIIEDLPEIKDVEPLFNLWNNFYKSVNLGKNISVSGEDGRKALELAITIAENIRRNNEGI
ncbi:MAG: Gfo/Idh/MocA family oxidoreductase [Acidobacteria bacterium]|jgi:predicted dehydrogenase|nr:Gfo/Idh/MocA family oxidoreductase [Acidobacteriota bacterium]